MPQGRHTSLTVHLTPDDRATLEAWQRATTIAMGRARRARLVLLLAEGMPIIRVADTVGISRRHVYKWAARFLAQGCEGLADLPRPKPAHRRRDTAREATTMADDAPFRYEPLPPPQPACTGCWQAPATARVWQGRTWREALCDVCTREHRREHRAKQGELWEEEGRP